MTLANHWGYSAIDKNLMLSCFWISFFIWRLHWGCSLFNFSLISLSWGSKGRQCCIMEGSNLGISSYDHESTSKYALSNWIRSILSSVDNEVPIWSSRGWSLVPKSIVLKSLSTGSTIWPEWLKMVFESELGDWASSSMLKTCEVDEYCDKLREELYDTIITHREIKKNNSYL